MTYRWVVGDLRTGKLAREFEALNPSWSVGFSGNDTLSVDIPGRALTEAGELEWPHVRADTAAAKNFLAVAWVNERGEETWITGGPIWTRNRARVDGIITVGASGLWSYWNRRLLVPTFSPGVDIALLGSSWSGAQTGLIAKRMLEQAQAHPDGAVPLDLPTDAELGGPGTAHVRNYPAHELAYVGTRLRELSETESGPEIQFVPYRRDDDPRFIRWATKIGTAPTMAISQPGAPHVIDDTVPDSPILDVGSDESGGALGTRSFAAGQGQGEGRPIRVATSTELTSIGYPLLDVDTVRDNVLVPATLDGYAQAQLAESSRPVETTTITMNADEFWNLYPTARPGDMAELTLPADEWDDGQPQPVRFVTIAGGKSNTIDITCMSREGRL